MFKAKNKRSVFLSHANAKVEVKGIGFCNKLWHLLFLFFSSAIFGCSGLDFVAVALSYNIPALMELEGIFHNFEGMLISFNPLCSCSKNKKKSFLDIFKDVF